MLLEIRSSQCILIDSLPESNWPRIKSVMDVVDKQEIAAKISLRIAWVMSSTRSVGDGYCVASGAMGICSTHRGIHSPGSE